MSGFTFPALTRISAFRSGIATARCILPLAIVPIAAGAHSIASAGAQSYPTRPVHIVVGFAAGAPNDILARLFAQWLTGRLGQPFVVENRPGASSNIGRAPPAFQARPPTLENSSPKKQRSGAGWSGLPARSSISVAALAFDVAPKYG
jgi:hypothetical protein